MKTYIFLSTFIIILFSMLLPFYGCKNQNSLSVSPVTALANQIESGEDLIKALENEKKSEERIRILEKNRELIIPELIIDILNKTKDQDLSLEEKQYLTIIAIEVAEFAGDKKSLGKALYYSFELADRAKKDMDIYFPNLEKACKLFQETGDKKGEVSSLYNQAYYFNSILNDDEKAFEILNQSETIVDGIDDDLFKADYYYSCGSIYWGDKDKAIENFNKALVLYKKEEDFIHILGSYEHMAGCCFYNGFYEECEGYHEKIKALIESYPHKLKDLPERKTGYMPRPSASSSKEEWLGRYYGDKANLYRWRGQYEQAIRTYKEMIELKDEIEIYYIADAYNALGWTYANIGRTDMALKYYLETLKIDYEEAEFARCRTYEAIGHLYLRQIKDPDEAINYYMLALEEAEKLPRWKNSYKFCINLCIAEAYAEKGEFEKAIKDIEKLLEDEKKSREFSCYNSLSKIYMQKGDYKKAINCITKQIELEEIDGDIRWMALSYKDLGDCYRETGRLSEAMEVYLKSLDITEQYRLSSLWENYFSIGKLCEKQEEYDKAFKYYSKAIEFIENMRREFRVEELKRDFMQDKIEVYEYMINLLFKMKMNEEAFEYNEKARARAFLDILANQKISLKSDPAYELITKEEELQTRIRIASTSLINEKSNPPEEQRSIFIEKTDKQLQALKTEYEEILENMKLSNTEYISLIGANPFSLSEIQSMLAEDTVILEYFLTNENSYLWIIGKNDFHTITIEENRENISSLVKNYRDIAFENVTVEKINSNEWKKPSKELYSILFKDAEKFIKNKKRILISPHRVLHYLPFHTLMDKEEKTLVEKYEIAYLPSASVLKFCQDKNHMEKDNLLAFELGNFTIEEYPPLPGTEIEIDKISSSFPGKEIYCGKDMKTDVLYEKSDNFQVLHFATHGIMVPEAPLFSSLLFADKPLKVYEIFDLNLSAYLITLSACNTGLPEEANGDELVGLSRAFIYAGTPSICSSLWDVSDKSTAEFMERFYFHLKDKNKSESLRLAQLEIKEKYPHPYFWAPFILIGDWR